MAKSAHDILKEYLIAIGFEIDEEKDKRVSNSLERLKQRIEEIGSVAVGAAIALSASVTRMASSLESLYFASQRTGASVANIKALEFSAQQIGITAETSRGMLEAFARSLRLNPGLTGYLRSMGVDTTKDKVEMLMDLVDRLRRMPFPVAARVASLFGIDDNALMMMIKNYDELRRAQEEQKKLGKDLKYDEMAEKAHRFMVELRDLGIRMESLGMIIADRFMPAGKVLIHFLEEVIDFLLRADKATDGWSSRLVGLGTAVSGIIGSLGLLRGALSILGLGGAAGSGAAAGGVLSNPVTGLTALGAVVVGGSGHYLNEARKHYNLQGEDRERMHLRRLELLQQQGRLHPSDVPVLQELRKKYPQGSKGPAASGPGGFQFSPEFLARHPSFNVGSKDPHDLIRKYANAMGVDVSLIEAQAWWESRFNQNAKSSKGALGVMQLMPDTARGLGVDPNNMEDNIRGGIQLMHDLLQKYRGNIALALAAYNSGEGAVQRYGGVPPFSETQQYVSGIMGNMDRYRLGQDFSTRPSVVMTQKTDINVNGSDSPDQVGHAVGKEQDRVNGDMLRNLQGNMQ